MILKLLDFQQLFKIEMAFILTYPIDFITCTGLQGLPNPAKRFNQKYPIRLRRGNLFAPQTKPLSLCVTIIVASFRKHYERQI